MTVSYTPSLGLALPVTGTEINVWGNVVNGSVTSLVDAAVAGYLSIQMADANYTLTNTAGAANEARNMMLNMTTAAMVPLTATRNVIAPSVSKLYIVTNSTGGGQAITWKTATGIGVSILNGITKAIACNGVDMTEVTSSGGGGGGSSGYGLLYENNTIAATSYTITAGKNAMSAGPITVNAGVVITVPVGSVYTIV
jgi:hypothetical protein